jgi:hypothetical protein
VVAHVVLFTPKASVSAEERAAFLRMLDATFRAVPDIARVRVGRRRGSDRPYEQLGQHYTYIALLEFETPAALQRYLDHPAHDALAEAFYLTLERAEVGDFELASEVGALPV